MPIPSVLDIPYSQRAESLSFSFFVLSSVVVPVGPGEGTISFILPIFETATVPAPSFKSQLSYPVEFPLSELTVVSEDTLQNQFSLTMIESVSKETVVGAIVRVQVPAHSFSLLVSPLKADSILPLHSPAF